MKRRSKYGAVPTVVDNIRFASAKEAARYRELKMLEKAGEIQGLECQPVFPLEAKRGGAIGSYVADFRYADSKWNVVIEDVKGFKTALYKWKKRHVEAQYGIMIHEV